MNTPRRIGPTVLLILVSVSFLLLSSSFSRVTAQNAATATSTIAPSLPNNLPTDLPVIVAANADRLTPVAVLSPDPALYGASWSPDGQMLAVYGEKGVWLYSLSALRSPRFFPTDFAVCGVEFGPDGQHIAATYWGANKVVGVLLRNTSSEDWDAQLPNVVAPFFTADNGTLLVVDQDLGAPRLLFWDIHQGQYRTASADIYLIAVSPNGRVIASAQQGQDVTEVSLRDSKTGQPIKVLDHRSQVIKSIAFDPSAKVVAAVGKYGLMKLWDTTTGQLKYVLGTDLSGTEDPEQLQFSVSFSSDGTLISLAAIPAGHMGWADLWDVATGKHLDGFLTDFAYWVYFTSTTTMVVADGRIGTTHLNGTVNTDLEPLAGASSPQFNPSRTLIAAVRNGNSVVLYAVR